MDIDDDRATGDVSADDTADTGNDTGGAAAKTADAGPAAADKGASDAGKTTDAAGKAAEAGKTPDASTDKATPKPGMTDVFGDNWRDQIASGLPADQQDKAKKFLAARQSPYDVLRTGMAADQKISELMRDRVRIPTGDGKDDPKEVELYRKARGVPSEPKDYKVAVPEEFGQLTSLDEGLRDEFLGGAHKLNWGQKDVDYAIQTHFAIQRTLAAQTAKRALESSQRAQDDLRVEFGKEYRGNVELVNRMFAEGLARHGMEDGEERLNFFSKRFADGTAVGEHPAFVKMMVEIARERADSGALLMGESSDGGGQDLDKREKEIMAMMHSDPKEYQSAEIQKELQNIIANQNRRKGKK